MNMPRNILVVDDNPNNVEVLHEMLDDSYNLIEAANGWEALALAEELEPQIVLLDVMLPIIDGHEVCRKMRMIPAMRRSLIIMISAKAMPSELQAGLDAGADDYLTKPFDETDLYRVLRERGAGPCREADQPGCRDRSLQD